MTRFLLRLVGVFIKLVSGSRHLIVKCFLCKLLSRSRQKIEKCNQNRYVYAFNTLHKLILKINSNHYLHPKSVLNISRNAKLFPNASFLRNRTGWSCTRFSTKIIFINMQAQKILFCLSRLLCLGHFCWRESQALH